MGIPRLQVITGTSDVKQSRERNDLVGLLIEAGATDVITALHCGDITIPELWQEYERSKRVLLDLVTAMRLRLLTDTSATTVLPTNAPMYAVPNVIADRNGVGAVRPTETETTTESFWKPVLDQRARAEAAYSQHLWPTLENVDEWPKKLNVHVRKETTKRYRVSMLALHD
jgi:hypothetical protein